MRIKMKKKNDGVTSFLLLGLHQAALVFPTKNLVIQSGTQKERGKIECLMFIEWIRVKIVHLCIRAQNTSSGWCVGRFDLISKTIVTTRPATANVRSQEEIRRQQQHTTWNSNRWIRFTIFKRPYLKLFLVTTHHCKQYTGKKPYTTRTTRKFKSAAPSSSSIRTPIFCHTE